MKTNPNDATFTNAADEYGNPTLGQGLTKREYFAALAMQSILTNGYYNDVSNQIAQIAVNYANNLICALNETNKE